MSAAAEAATEAAALAGYTEDSHDGVDAISSNVFSPGGASVHNSYAHNADNNNAGQVTHDNAEDDGGARKRRRQPVDYAALDKELQQQKGAAGVAALDQ